MSRSVVTDFSGYTDRELIEYGAHSAKALDIIRDPAARKMLHAANANILKLLAARLPQRPRMLPATPAPQKMVMVMSDRTIAPDGNNHPGDDNLVVE